MHTSQQHNKQQDSVTNSVVRTHSTLGKRKPADRCSNRCYLSVIQIKRMIAAIKQMVDGRENEKRHIRKEVYNKLYDTGILSDDSGNIMSVDTFGKYFAITRFSMQDGITDKKLVEKCRFYRLSTESIAAITSINKTNVDLCMKGNKILSHEDIKNINHWAISFGHEIPALPAIETKRETVIKNIEDVAKSEPRKTIPIGKEACFEEKLREIVLENNKTRLEILKELESVGMNYLGRENTYSLIRKYREEAGINRDQIKIRREIEIRRLAIEGKSVEEIAKLTNTSETHAYKKIGDFGLRNKTTKLSNVS